jgi:exodeoxyribonuclease V gamma subunit
MAEPLILLNKSGWAWLAQCFDQSSGAVSHDAEKQEKGRSKLLQAWQGDYRVPGEGADPYIQRVFRQIDTQKLHIIVREAERYLLPIARHNLA